MKNLLEKDDGKDKEAQRLQRYDTDVQKRIDFPDIPEVQGVGVGQEIKGVTGGQVADKFRHALHGVKDVAPPERKLREGEGHPEMVRHPAVKFLGGQAARVVAGFVGSRSLGSPSPPHAMHVAPRQ